MTAEKATLQRVQAGLFHLRKGLTPFVEARMRGRHGADWLRYASRAQGRTSETALDEYGLLKTMIDQWRGVFDDAFDPGEDTEFAVSFLSQWMDATLRITRHRRCKMMTHYGTLMQFTSC